MRRVPRCSLLKGTLDDFFLCITLLCFMLSCAKLPRDILFGFPLLILWNSLLGVVPTSSFPNPSGTEFDCSPVPQEGSVVAVAQESWGGRGYGPYGGYGGYPMYGGYGMYGGYRPGLLGMILGKKK
ncbi:hypothetical protein GCK72_018994 [Caenorhabditis remanei]|uniref:Uncharacterized protein n=1 Tax=Caenorhabditis remanei TaxID=31234 RepID=A0A6A5GDE1_CAERE|nr:hypothetical protein GCK72_018994 [Caenorhabditis remanei]KAF1752439.1 hypothetical protein GCK72_018994 [Caenorhabditis remanei]